MYRQKILRLEERERLTACLWRQVRYLLRAARLTADGQTYEPILDREETAKYFYDYSDPASTVLNDYEDFVTRENWSRSGRERGGGK